MLRSGLLLAGSFGTVALLYLPFWNGFAVLDGLFEQTEIVRRSLHFLILQATGIRSLATGLGISGVVVAVIMGFIVSMRQRSIAVAVALTVGIQTVFGRTFFQPWSICPLVFLAAWSIAEEPAALVHAPGVSLNAMLARVVPVFSASALIGGYVPYILVSSPGSPTEWISTAIILSLPAIVMLVAWYRHRPVIPFK